MYKDKQREAVIETILKGYPLNVMYWAVRNDGNFEIIDGQQRTISTCQFVKGEFAVRFQNDLLYFHNLQSDIQQKILKYELMIYLCSGTDSEKLEWFRTINIAGEKLTDQELLNAVYAGSMISDAKRYFSKTGCAAYQLGNKYIDGNPIRQDYLETIIKWISKNNIENYMGKNQFAPNANELWKYFNDIINWVQKIFPTYRKEMKGVEWGDLYNEFKDKDLDSKAIEAEVAKLMADEDVGNKKGIYYYVLNHKEKHLNLRAFDDKTKRTAFEKQNGICKNCQNKFDINEMEADHITPWHLGGKTNLDNCQLLCKEDNRRKSGK